MAYPETLTQKEFAALAGFKPSYITALKQAGRLVMEGKRVRVAESLARIRETGDPAKAAVAQRHAEARASAPATVLPAAARTDEGDDGEASPTSTGYTYWRERTERAKALAAERDNAKEEGKLLEAAQVDAAIASAVTQLRTSLEAMPYDLAPELAPITDEGELRARLVEAIEHALGELARQFGNVTREEAA